MATGSPILSFGPIPLLRTARIPIISPRPAIPVEHQRPVEYCWARLCPFSISTASVVAAEMANATPEPIWNDVLSCSGLYEYFDASREIGLTYHSSTQTFNFDWNTGQYCRACSDKNKRDSSYTDK